jgi:hypothetical protein
MIVSCANYALCHVELSQHGQDHAHTSTTAGREIVDVRRRSKIKNRKPATFPLPTRRNRVFKIQK